MESNTIEYMKASSFFETSEQFAKELYGLLSQANKVDKSVIMRDKETLKEYFEYSIIAVDEDSMIGSATCHEADMVPKMLNIDGDMNLALAVGEVSSVVLKYKYRGRGIGKRLLEVLHDFSKDKFDVIIEGTVSPQMKSIRERQGYKKVEFPLDLYEQGINNLGKLIGKEKFVEYATCHLYVGDRFPISHDNILSTINNYERVQV